MSYKNYKFFSLKFYLFPIFLLIFQTHTFATENHNFTLFDIKLGSNISTIPNLKFIDECKKKIYSRSICENKIVYQANFTPKNKYDSIVEYQVLFSPISKKIYSISGYPKKFGTMNQCYDFFRPVAKIVNERLVNDNQKIIISKHIYDSGGEFRLNQEYSGSNVYKENVKILFKAQCWPIDFKKPFGAGEGLLSISFDDFYYAKFIRPEFDNFVLQKQNEMDNKNKGKLRNF
jgi:hypothetical protein